MHRSVGLAMVAGLAIAFAGCGGAAPSAATQSIASSVGAPSPSAEESVPPSAAAPSTAAAPATAGPTATPTPSPTPEATMPPFTLTSTDFDAGGLIPRRFTCDGEDVSPGLAWTGVPAGAKALVLFVDDPDARGWVHWIVLDVPGDAEGSLPRDVSPSAATPAQGRNDFGKRGWGGPCPPSGTHRYDFTLYALAAPLGLSGTPDGSTVRRALDKAHVLGKVKLEGRYRRS